MGLKLQDGKTHELSNAVNNPSANTKHGDYYAHIKEFSYNAKDKRLSFVVLIYGSEEFSPKNNSEINPLDAIGINVNPNSFDDEIGSNGATMAQLYAIALKHSLLADWKSDE